MPKKAATTRLTTITALPVPPDMQGPLDKQFHLVNGQIVERPEITAAQIKRALMGVTDMESGCKFIADYKSIASNTNTINISIDQLIGLKRTVALAEKLVQLKENDFAGAKDYFSKGRILQAIQVVPNTAISKWLQGKKVKHSGYLYPVQREYQELIKISTASKKKYSTLTPLERESIEANKLMGKVVYTLDWQKLGLDDQSSTYLVYDDSPNSYACFTPLFDTNAVLGRNGVIRNDYFVSGSIKEEMAARLTIAHIIGKMISTLIPRLDVSANGQFIFSGNARDWWSTIALHFRDRLLEAVNPPCLACGQEILNTERSSKKYCNGTCRKRAHDRKKKAQ